MINISISFIVIWKNEGWKITKCISSIYKTIKDNDINEYEIIYVDSKSYDDSIERAKKFKGLRVIQLTGDCNAAIARNVGASVSKGEVLFFIDGDMELISDTFSNFYNNEAGIYYPFMSGNLIYYFYDKNWNFIYKEKEPHIKIEKDTYQSKTGGLFFINKEAWESIGGMKEYLDLGEEPDLALRLAKRKILLLRKKDVLVKHHTIHYFDISRKWKRLYKVSSNRAILYRENLSSLHAIKLIFFQDYSAIILLSSLFLAIFTNNFLFLLLYLLSLIFKSLRKRKNILSNIIFYFCRDNLLIFSSLFLYPKRKNVDYKIIKWLFKI